MAWTPFQIFLSLLLVITGSLNTITAKWGDRMDAKGSDGTVRKFNHPFVQASAMFLGELCCMAVFYIFFFYLKHEGKGRENQHTLTKGNRSFNPLVLLAPAMLDMGATSLLYVGLNLTYASSMQMLRGSVIVFTAILARIFLGSRQGIRQWIGIILIIGGLVTVGASDMLLPSSDAGHNTDDIILGDLLIIGGQVMTALQVVLEEKYVAGLDIPPLQAVGWEGLYGFVVLSLLQIPMYWIKVPAPFSDNSHGVLEDAPDAFAQMADNNLIIVAIVGTIISIAFFNYAGISVTKEMTSTTRMVLDSVRTLLIWAITLALKWQDFYYLQVIGFIILILGMLLYNNIFIMQALEKIWMFCRRRTGSRASLIINIEVENP